MSSLNTTILTVILICNLIFLVSGLVYLVKQKRFLVIFKKFLFNLITKKTSDYVKMQDFAQKLSGILIKMSNDVVGALIVIENKDTLTSYAQLGYSVASNFSSEFVMNIFYNKSSPLHDGGIIIKNDKIVAVSTYFPMTKKNLPAYYGARHRAAIGISEATDAIAFIVSETSGKISFAKNGKITVLNRNIEQISKQIYSLLTHNHSDYTREEITITNDLEQG